MGSHTQKGKAMTLTSHTTAMHFMVQFPGDRMIPRERFSPRSQFFVGATSKQGAEQLMAHRQMMHDLQHLNQHSNRHGKQNQRLERIHHVGTA